jgi:hypothetical protein
MPVLTTTSAIQTGWALGVFFILIVAALWAGASVIIQYIFQDLDFDQPFVLT